MVVNLSFMVVKVSYMVVKVSFRIGNLLILTVLISFL